MKKDRVTGAKGRSPRKTFFTTSSEYQGNALLDIKICPFPRRKDQLHLLFQSYLPIYRFYHRFKHFSNTNFVINWGGGGRSPLPPGYAEKQGSTAGKIQSSKLGFLLSSGHSDSAMPCILPRFVSSKSKTNQ